MSDYRQPFCPCSPALMWTFSLDDLSLWTKRRRDDERCDKMGDAHRFVSLLLAAPYSFSRGLDERYDFRALPRWHDVPVVRCVSRFDELAIMREQHVAVGMAHFESEGCCVFKFR
jgi:hypothetical protein